MKAILSKRANTMWEYIQLTWFVETMYIYFWFLGLI